MSASTATLPDALARAADVVPILRMHAAESDATATFPAASLRALREHGLLGLMVPSEYAGPGAGLATFVDVAQALAAGCLSTAQIWAMHCFQVDAIVRYGSAELRADLLPRIAREQVYIASVTSERGRSSSLFSANAPLVGHGGHLSVKRSAPVVTGGTQADGFLITMRAESGSEHDVAWVYADRTNLTRADLVGTWNTLGMRGTESIGMELEGTVPRRNVLGSDDERCPDVARESMIPISHLGWSACWLGAATGALRELVREFRRSAATRGDQSDLFYERLGRIRVDLELVSSYLTRVREELEDIRRSGGSMATPRAQLHVNTLKLTASELTFQAVNRMIQVAGLRLGYNRDAAIPLERHFRDLRAASLNHSNDSLWAGVGALTLVDQSVSLV